MQYARALLVFICLFLCACSQYVRLPTFVPYSSPPLTKQWHVFVTGEAVLFDAREDWPASRYNGVEFPVYYGYVYSEDDVLYFVKKTRLLFPTIDDFKERVLAEQGLKDIAPDRKFKLLPDRGFWLTLWRHFTEMLPGAHNIRFTGPPNDSYQPRFKRTCTFNADAGQFCTRSILPETQPDLTLIPTSSEILPRRYGSIEASKNKPEIYYVEDYNPQSGGWERKPLDWKEYNSKTSRWERVMHW